jgi:pimeloyl-ACP methyl ester carboxylesterase
MLQKWHLVWTCSCRKAFAKPFAKLKGVVKIQGAGHMPPEEKPAEVNELVLKFLKSL